MSAQAMIALEVLVQSDLIFDVGLHTGEDTTFYLKKGFRVVAVEADPELCESVASRFVEAIDTGQLMLVNKALARTPGPITFYRNLDKSIWGTLDPEWAERNSGLFGTKIAPITVEATTISELMEQFGTPYYLKLDIEGFDMVGVEGLEALADRPKYVSIESDKDSLKAIRREFHTFAGLGYDRFKIVNQGRVPRQTPPSPPREGKFADHRFELGASGLFGEEAPGKWLSIEEAIDAYRPILLKYALIGDDPLLRGRWGRGILYRMGIRANWYDTHARLRAA
jgi:FkbM family methyltransferase